MEQWLGLSALSLRADEGQKSRNGQGWGECDFLREGGAILRQCRFMRFFLMALMFTVPLMGFEDKVRPILEKNCLECHGGKKVKGDVDFSKNLTVEDADKNFELWETVVEVIEEGRQGVDTGDSEIIGETYQSYTATQSGNYAVVLGSGLCADTSDCYNVNVLGIGEIPFNNNKNLFMIIDLMG